MGNRLPRLQLLLSLLPLLLGCGLNDPPRFELNLEGRDPAKITVARKESIAAALAALFGTPDEPRVPEGVHLAPALLKRAAGPVGNDVRGTPRGLYRQHCVACHGISGSGAGPNAALLSPWPRDFRRGIFKYTSTSDGAKPTADDLCRTLRRGIPGTAMPSFMQLADEDVNALVEYVKYLSIRGETERHLLALVVDRGQRLPLDMNAVKEDGVKPVDDAWQAPVGDPSLVVEPPSLPPDTPEERLASIARGRQVFLSKEAQCVRCHGQEGRGDGPQKDLYDDWNKPKIGKTPDETEALTRLFAMPLTPVRPRNFTEGIFHGGSRPIDLYWRICVGIKGTPMPAAGPGKAGKGALSPAQIWDLATYVRWLAIQSRGR
jgi:mono/diheme cytochrome c family protein